MARPPIRVREHREQVERRVPAVPVDQQRAPVRRAPAAQRWVRVLPAAVQQWVRAQVVAVQRVAVRAHTAPVTVIRAAVRFLPSRVQPHRARLKARAEAAGKQNGAAVARMAAALRRQPALRQKNRAMNVSLQQRPRSYHSPSASDANGGRWLKGGLSCTLWVRAEQ